MTTRMIFDPSKVSPVAVEPTAWQRRLTFAVAAAIIVVTALLIPFSAVQFQPVNGFIPAAEAVIVVCDLLTATLLASHAMANGSRGLLFVAGGFLFDALVIFPHAMTFPGAFTPTGLFGAGLQTTGWLFAVWHLGLPVAVIAYVCVKRDTHVVGIATVLRGAAAVMAFAAALAWIAIAYGDDLPRLFADRRSATPLANLVAGFDFAVSAAALLMLLGRRRKSVLDLWLTVTVVALVAELAVTTFILTGRFSLAFYVSRSLSLAASTIVLIALVAETIGQGLRLARANFALELERSRKLTTLDAALGAITHEVKQPISSIVCNAEAAQAILASSAPNLKELREIAAEIAESSFRTNEIFENIRGLYGESRHDMQPLDMNGVIAGILRGVEHDMKGYGITARAELESKLPAILGHKGQLQEVIVNLVHNALDAMRSSPGRERILRVRTVKRGRRAIRIVVEDSGPGIGPGQVERIFDPFVTTKKNGMGMGLAICRMIVERHGGHLFASPDVTTGARFVIVLPIKPPADPHQQPAADVTAPPQPPLLRLDGRRTVRASAAG